MGKKTLEFSFCKYTNILIYASCGASFEKQRTCCDRHPIHIVSGFEKADWGKERLLDVCCWFWP